jgi:hypothetical protein
MEPAIVCEFWSKWILQASGFRLGEWVRPMSYQLVYSIPTLLWDFAMVEI